MGGVGVGVGLKGACPAKPSNARTLAALTALQEEFTQGDGEIRP